MITNRESLTNHSPELSSRLNLRPEDYEEKLYRALEFQAKLKELYDQLKKSNQSKPNQQNYPKQQRSSLALNKQLKQQQQQLSRDIEHLTNNLNNLINENNKMKIEVNSHRNSRVIFSNIYKNIQKEITNNEYRYKNSIIQTLAYEETYQLVVQKISKIQKKLEKQIEQLSQPKIQRSRLVRKSRLDTGLDRQHQKRNTESETKSKYQGNTSRFSAQSKKQGIQQELKGFEDKKQPTKIDKQLNKQKSLQEQNNIATDYLNFQLKKVYYDSIIKRLKQVCQVATLPQIETIWSNIDNLNDIEYQKYQQLEQELQSLEKLKKSIQLEYIKSRKQQSQFKSSEEIDLQKKSTALDRQLENIKQIEKQWSLLMDINFTKLSNQQIKHHLMLIQSENLKDGKDLEKPLEASVKKTNTTQKNQI